MTASIVSASADLPALDLTIQAWVDRHDPRAEGIGAFHSDSASGCPVILPFASNRKLPLLVHVFVASPHAPSRHEMFEACAHALGMAVLPCPVKAGESLEIAQTRIRSAVEAARKRHADTVDHGRLVLSGDGVGGLLALQYGMRDRPETDPPRLILLSTPVLSAADEEAAFAWLTPEEAKNRTQSAKSLLIGGRWPIEQPFEILKRLPPVFVVLAEADPFQAGARRLIDRLLVADLDVSAATIAGTIADFAWLPGLTGSAPARMARDLMAGAISAAGIFEDID